MGSIKKCPTLRTRNSKMWSKSAPDEDTKKNGVTTKRSFLPGQRLRIYKEMERQVRGFRDISRDLTMARRMLEQQEKIIRDSLMDRTIKTSFYKSVMATRTTKLSGAFFHTVPVARVAFFSSTERM